MKNLTVINWNICFNGYNKKKFEFLFSLVDSSCCITLQEVQPEVGEYLKKTYADKYNFVYSLDYRKPGLFDKGARQLGVMIMVSKDIDIVESGVVDRALFPDRTTWAKIVFNGQEIKVLSLHSITGCDYKKAKSIQYDTLGEFIYYFKPDIIGMDANEPKIDSYDIDKMEFFSNGNGALGFFRGMRREGLVDSFVKANNITECIDGECLTTSHYVSRKKPVRYDFVFVNKEYKILSCEYLLKEALEADSDHALIFVKLQF